MDAKKRVVRRRRRRLRRRRLIVPKALSASMKKENPTRARHSHSRHSPAENGPQFNATPSNPNARVISRPIPTSRRRPLLDSAIWKDLFTRSRARRETSTARTLYTLGEEKSPTRGTRVARNTKTRMRKKGCARRKKRRRRRFFHAQFLNTLADGIFVVYKSA